MSRLRSLLGRHSGNARPLIVAIVACGAIGLAVQLMLSGPGFGQSRPPAKASKASLTLIHMGDIHGHLVPRPNLRRDASGKSAGGLARMHTRIQEIRKRNRNVLLMNTGDTIQGSAEALFTRGQALVDVLNLFKIDFFAPGNWEFVYGPARFIELFGAEKGGWGTVAANVYYDGEPYADRTGKTVVPGYRVRTIGGLKVGVMGLTTRRGPQVVGTSVTKGLRFTSGDAEVPRMLKQLREVEKVDVVILLSEQELANNIRIAEANPGIHVILSSDMHEVTRRPIVAKTGTIIVEEGQDGTVLGEINLGFEGGKLAHWRWTAHNIDETIKASPAVARKIADVRRSFVAGPGFKKHKNPFNGTLLARPIDTVVGTAKVGLHRSGFTDDAFPAVIEGTSHNFLTDAFRAVAGADIGGIRGFRYGTHVPAGPIRMEDLYHFIPIGPMIAKGTIKGQQLKNQIENSAEGALSTDTAKWTGGWLFNFSGVTADIDVAQGKGKRASNILVRRSGSAAAAPLDLAASYTYASYYYAADPKLINVVPSTDIQVLKDEAGNPLDGVEVVVRYLASLPGKAADPGPRRFRLLTPLPAPAFGNPEIQPLKGVPAR